MIDNDFHIKVLEEVLECVIRASKQVGKAYDELDNGGGSMPIKRLEGALSLLEDAQEKLEEQLDAMEDSVG